jgi:predicted metal-binding membrane protein
MTSPFNAMTSTRPVTIAGAVTATVAAAVAAWILAAQQMSGMDMGPETELGSLGFFIGVWVLMMAAMMLPGAAPAVSRFIRAEGRALATPVFAGSYIAVWTLVGLAAYALYRPHGSTTAGALTIAAGVYELTPLKRECRQLCRNTTRSGFRFGIYCLGSSIGLMVILLSLGVMSLTWMALVAAIVVAQKLLPPRAFIDGSIALAIVGLGIWLVVAPSSVPGLVTMM